MNVSMRMRLNFLLKRKNKMKSQLQTQQDKSCLKASKLAVFYEDIVGFDDYIEVRIMKVKEKYMFSEYAANWDELIIIMKKYSKPEFNIYFGINTRKIKGKKDKDIEYRQLFYFDIEHKGKKPALSDVYYNIQLKHTIDYIKTNMLNMYDMQSCALVISGRGYHLYYKIKPILETPENKRKFKEWYKNIQKIMEKNRPHQDIKFSDSVFNIGRIASAPGTRNTKYKEMPARKIIFIAPEEVNDNKQILDYEIKIIRPAQTSKSLKCKKYTEDTIIKSPEFLLLTEYPVPEGNRHSTLILALKLLMRNNGLTNTNEIEHALDQAGMPGEKFDINELPEDYTYSKGILINWCINNYEWCDKVGYKIPYDISDSSFGKTIKNKKGQPDKEILEWELNTYSDIREFIKDYNTNTVKVDENKFTYYTYDLLRLLDKLVTDKKLLIFLKNNKIIERIMYTKNEK